MHCTIGPDDESCDVAVLIKQVSRDDFFAFASNPNYLAAVCHRKAAVQDSRLLPVDEWPPP